MAKDKRTYWEKLQDPRWQKRRLEILERDNFACLVCHDKTETLHVHHGYYRKDLEPWEYPAPSLHTLCETCHADIQRELLEIHEKLAFMHPSLLYDVQLLLSQFSEAWPYHFVIEDHDRWLREPNTTKPSAKDVVSNSELDGTL